MRNYLPIWWDFRNARVPVVLSFGYFSLEVSSEPRPDIRLGKSVYETAVRKRFYHINSSSVDSKNKLKMSDMRGKILERIGIFLERNIGWKWFLCKYVVKHICVIIQNSNGFIGKCLRNFVYNPLPGSYREISKLLHSDKETYPRPFYLLTVVIERSDILVYEIPKRIILCKYFRYNLYITFDEIDIGVVNIGVGECDIEDMRSPEDIRSGNNGIVELFIFENRIKIPASHVEKKYLFVSVVPVIPSERESLREKLHMFQNHPRKFRLIIIDIFLFFDNTNIISCIFEVLEEETIILGSKYNNLGCASIRSEPLYEKLNKRFWYNRIPDSIRAIEIKSFQFLQIDTLRFFHGYDAFSQKYPEPTRDSEED